MKALAVTIIVLSLRLGNIIFQTVQFYFQRYLLICAVQLQQL
jgi:hypothetical protein